MVSRIAGPCTAALGALFALLTPGALAAGGSPLQTNGFAFAQSRPQVDAFDYVEVTVRAPAAPAGHNPFDDAVTGSFGPAGTPPVRVAGFCDSQDGTLYRIRFMPQRAGRHAYRVEVVRGGVKATHQGTFRALKGRRSGLLRVDPAHPWHFVWSGSGKHYFWNGTTTYAMLGCDDPTIRASIDRLAGLQVNRIRAALYPPRVESGRAWHEPVFPSAVFQPVCNPWVAARPQSVHDPGFDVTRFNVAHWQKYERLVHHARERGVVVSVIFYVDGARAGTDPFGKALAGGPEEQRYYRYAAARLSAFANITWDITNEYHLFRDDAWAERMGAFLKSCDPYGHLASVHGFEQFRFRKSPWADFAMHQAWDEGGGHGFMLRCRRLQQEAGRPMPQVNEEYGYEDHYPHWGGDPTGPPARSADNRRRLAWGMAMAGGYQTTGERANNGQGGEDPHGGGWVNGRGHAGMRMLEGYAHMVRFFTRLEWWRLDPRDDLVGAGALCLAEPGRTLVAWLRRGGSVNVQLEPGDWSARWYNPRDGRYQVAGKASGPLWRSPAAPDTEDWVLLLRRGKAAGEGG